ncbi:hypothetical protein MOJ79_16150 [Calidifontimicrobium sp. SYSU G02091]|uniref:hypothetical protein n=1 Tax=Calidifontimicrobium sp. SYSU G02091 TaxID=2926421 RepID=UPI001F530AF0|nr:hypothetical protein [Calidifontimicrobium sp. SYSU G02091]MCI1193370.1 hypothetical protein [Calidifontimicrobium sp. SYSU G02091]
MTRLTASALAVLLTAAGAAHATDTAKTKPTASAARAAKPSARGPGTQTEDDLYVGAKAKAQASKESLRRRPGARGGDDDLEDLEVQRSRAKQK